MTTFLGESSPELDIFLHISLSEVAGTFLSKVRLKRFYSLGNILRVVNLYEPSEIFDVTTSDWVSVVLNFLHIVPFFIIWSLHDNAVI